jgi:type IV pilus assembly protein PilN
MFLDLNLASQPYQDVRRFAWRWSLALLAVMLVSAVLVYAAVGQWRAWRATNADARKLREQIARVDAENAAAAAFLNRPANRGTRDRSQFVNQLIARKAFSWTNVLRELEKIMPPQLHVVSIRPTVNDHDELQIALEVMGRSRESALDLVRHMEDSPDFRNAQVDSESLAQGSQTGDAVKFMISAAYVPDYAKLDGGH